jgi:hypothetical protein
MTVTMQQENSNDQKIIMKEREIHAINSLATGLQKRQQSVLRVGTERAEQLRCTHVSDSGMGCNILTEQSSGGVHMCRIAAWAVTY